MCRTNFSPAMSARASITALAMAGVEPMVAASPMPLTPNAVRGECVRVWSFWNETRSSVFGMA